MDAIPDPRTTRAAATRADERVLWIGLAVVFVPAVAVLVREWLRLEYYNHGFLVPLVAAVVAQPRLRRLGPSRRRAGGLAGVAGALLVYGVGLVFGSATLDGLALVGALAAMVGYRWGGAGLRALAFPLAFLLFMVPLPEVWVNPVIVWLQTLASSLAVGVLQGFGVAVHRDGNVVHLAGGESLFVAEACSGITSLLSLIPVGVLLARFTETVTWRRCLIVAFVVPAALLGNAVRVIATVAAAEQVGAARATSGPLHESAGLLTSVFAVLLVIAFGAALRRGLGGRAEPT